MTERLSTRRLNRALLARQLLLERSTASLPAALEQLAGIQNQYAPNAYLRLWSCLVGFRREQLTEAYEEGTVVQGTLMRGTIHAVSAADYHPFVAAIRRARQEWSRRVHRGDDVNRAQVVETVRRVLAGGPLRRRELDELLADAGLSVRRTVDTDAELVRAPPSGTWKRRRADLYALADELIGHHEEIDEDAGLKHLILRYLRGFGPAPARDAADFVGVPVTRISQLATTIDLRRFRDEAEQELLDVPDGPLPAEDTPVPVRFLPTWDAMLLVHARRTQILPEQYRPLVFNTKVPASFPTFLIDGQVAGTWRFTEGEIRLEPFYRLPGSVIGELNEEAGRLAAFHAD